MASKGHQTKHPPLTGLFAAPNGHPVPVTGPFFSPTSAFLLRTLRGFSPLSQLDFHRP